MTVNGTPGMLTTQASAEVLSKEQYAAGMKVTWVGMAVNAVLIVLKFFAGISGRSSALVADAAHSFSDFLTDIGVIVGLKYISKPADSTHAYGHGRIETTIAFLMGITIIITGIGLFRTGVHAVIHAFDGVFPEKPGIIALVMGVVSILSKEALFHYTRIVARRSRSRTIEANAWHHRSDAFSSVGTVIGVGGALLLGNKWTVLDPAAAIFVSILVVKVGFDIGWSSIKELTDESLSGRAQEEIAAVIRNVDGVMGTHKIKTRSLGRYVTVDAHIQVDPTISVRDGHNIATNVENAIRKSQYNVAFVTIHIEPHEDANDTQ